MKERPILFSAPMVRALLDGRKTQTRRVVKPKRGGRITGVAGPGMAMECIGIDNDGRTCFETLQCPYGQPGGRLWVREAFRFLDSFDGDSPARVGDLCLIAGYQKPWAPTQYEADGRRENWMNVGTSPGSITAGKLRPGIHMPRWASRILLEIVSVGVERLNDIGEADAIAEGAEPYLLPVHPAREGLRHVDGFARLWESLAGPGSWAANPWVWVVEFQMIEA